MITCFPDPYPDELLYSVCARYKDQMQYPNGLIAVQDMFGGTNPNAVVDLPNHIGNLVAELLLGHKYTVDDFINKNTHLPYYAQFLPHERLESVYHEMRGASSNHAYARLGILPNRLKLPKMLRFCPVCAQEDREPYWHRIHQLPGVEVCPLHKVFIETSSAHWLRRLNLDGITSAASAIHDLPPRPLDLTDLRHNLLLRVASNSAWLLTWRAPALGSEALRKRYYNLLLKKGYAYYNGRIRDKKLLEDFVEFYTPDFLTELRCEFGEERECWLLRILRTHKSTVVQHPLLHILLITFLGCTTEEFFATFEEYKPFGDGPWPCLSRASDHFEELRIKECKIYDGTKKKRGKPIGTFACDCGFIYTRTGPDHSEDDRRRLDSVVFYGPLWEDRLRTLWLDNSLTLTEIAQSLGVIQFTVKRHAIRLGLPLSRDNRWYRPTSEEVIERHSVFREALADALEARRSEWLTLFSDNPEAGRRQLQSLACYTYSWLRKHDPEWLESHMPEDRTPPPQPVRVDWEASDIQLSEAVKAAAKKLKDLKNPPARASITAICREVGHRSWIETRLDQLPLTAKAIAEHIESAEDLLIRRLKWAADQYRQQDLRPTRRQLKRLVSVNSAVGRTEKVQRTLNEIMSSFDG